jgi:uncharacterized membrane protein
MVKAEWIEVLLTFSAFLVLVIYHVRLVRRFRTAPLTTSFGVTDRLRKAWVESVMQERRDILAVQTLRNWVMASSFLASAAILIGLGLFNLAFAQEQIAHIAHSLNFFGTRNEAAWLIKLISLIVDFFFAFFNFTLSIRYYNHASFAINVPPSLDPLVSYDAVAAILNHGAIHYTMGMRGYYLAIPLTLWLFGPIWLLGGSITLILILNKLDRTA